MIISMVKKAFLVMSTFAFIITYACATDILIDVHYTPKADKRSFNIQTQISNLIASANKYYADNNLPLVLKLASKPTKVSIDYVASDEYVDPSDYGIETIFKNEKIRHWRDQHKADLVVVLGSFKSLPDGSGMICGVAGDIYGHNKSSTNYKHYESYAYNITATNCGNTVLTLVHELGHNMGLGHTVIQGGKGGVYDYGRGYGINNEFATIMGYPQKFNTKKHLTVFSDPARMCPSHYKCGNHEANAQKALNLIIDEIANFR